MSKFIAFMMLLATLGWALAGCESKDPNEPNLKGPPSKDFPPPSASMGGGPPPNAGGQKMDEGKAGETKGGDKKEDEQKSDSKDAGKEGEKKEDAKPAGADAKTG